MNEDHSAHCAKASSCSHLFPRKSKHKFWWESGIKKSKERKKKKE